MRLSWFINRFCSVISCQTFFLCICPFYTRFLTGLILVFLLFLGKSSKWVQRWCPTSQDGRLCHLGCVIAEYVRVCGVSLEISTFTLRVGAGISCKERFRALDSGKGRLGLHQGKRMSRSSQRRHVSNGFPSCATYLCSGGRLFSPHQRRSTVKPPVG